MGHASVEVGNLESLSTQSARAAVDPTANGPRATALVSGPSLGHLEGLRHERRVKGIRRGRQFS